MLSDFHIPAPPGLLRRHRATILRAVAIAVTTALTLHLLHDLGARVSDTMARGAATYCGAC